jgi:hypothetical protein
VPCRLGCAPVHSQVEARRLNAFPLMLSADAMVAATKLTVKFRERRLPLTRVAGGVSSVLRASRVDGPLSSGDLQLFCML